MTETRRKFLAMGAAALATAGLPLHATLASEARPLTTAGLAKSLLTLADKAELQGMTDEAQAIYAAVQVVLTGTKAKWNSNGPVVVKGGAK